MTGLVGRRGLIIGGLAAGLVAAGPHRTFGAASPFTLGIASGSPAPDGFVIWTRLAPEPVAPDGLGGMTGPAQVSWDVAEDEGMRRIVRRGQTQTDAALAHALHIEVGGLRADRPYWYRFTAMGDTSPIGRARTAPAQGARNTRLKLAIASCAHWETGWFSAYRHMAAEDHDLTLFLGDYIYEYGNAASRTDLVRHFDKTAECRTLIEYRNRHALYHTDPDLQALHAAAPCLATWDDHEVQNDYSADWSQIGTIPVEEFRARRLAAYRAFYEHMPLRPSVLTHAPEMRIYGAFDYGDLGRINVLDGRQYRSIQPCAVGGSRRGHVAPSSCADLVDPNRSMLGIAQETWLYDSFRTSTARWNLIAQDLLVAPYAQNTSDGQPGAFTEGWSGYAANRARMLAAIDLSHVKNPVFFGGDMHAYVTTDLKRDGFTGPTVATEFVGTSVTSDNAADSIAATLTDNPHVKLFDNRHHGYMTAELTPARMDTAFRVVSNRLDPNATVSTFKRFGVENGRAGAVEI
ncbi:MAG: alkaline phosphatase D family protein [Alphaproteobacteria bacterium]